MQYELLGLPPALREMEIKLIKNYLGVVSTSHCQGIAQKNNINEKVKKS